jgi:acyl-coenzyme A thioesterase PaaI-like protein
MEQIAIQDKWPDEGTHCWGCGKNNKEGLQIKSYWEGDETVCTWQPENYHLAFLGVTCGGIIASIIDCHCLNTAISAAYKAQGRDFGTKPTIGYVTGTLTVKYLKPTPINKPIVLRARIKETTERKIIVTCSVFSKKKECAKGELVAIKLGP